MNQPVAQQVHTILFPPGRLVSGDLYTPQDKDQQGAPLTIKTGPNAGKPRINYFFAMAVAKTQAQWWVEPWGVQVLTIANAAWPQGQTQNPNFAWKIEDGDSPIPNQAGRRNCDREGYPGHWILKFGSMFATKVFDGQGAPLLEPDLVKRGYWIETLGSIESNNNIQKPGIYLNHNMVAFRGRDKEITAGPDPRAVGFGRAAVPSHVTMAPAAGANFPAPSTPAVPGATPTPPGVPGNYTPAGGVPGAPSAYMPPGAPGVPGAVPAQPAYTPPPAPVGVQPNASFIAPPGPGVYPAVPGAAPTPPAPVAAYVDPLGAPAGHRMVNPAGPRYDAYRANNWTDALLIQNGHMVKL